MNPPGIDSRKYRILLAEDEEHIARLVAFKLTKEGFEVVIAKNGQEAIDRLPSGPWSLVLLDVMMPLRDGWQVLREIRAHSELKRLPVVMLTAKGADQDFANAAELGAEHYLKKPFDPAELASVVRKILGP